MSADPELVRAAIERDDAIGVRELLRHATEAERRACGRALGPLLDGPDDDGPYPEGWLGLAHRLAFQAAAFGLAPGAVPAGRHAYLLSRILSTAEFEVLGQVLDDRRPPWLTSFVDQRLAGWNVGPDAWVIARRLVTLVAIERPVIPEYTTRMVMALRRYAWEGEDSRTFTHLNPANGLLADPGLLEDEVWRLFTTPGVTRGLAPGTPRYPGRRFSPRPSIWSRPSRPTFTFCSSLRSGSRRHQEPGSRPPSPGSHPGRTAPGSPPRPTASPRSRRSQSAGRRKLAVSPPKAPRSASAPSCGRRPGRPVQGCTG